MTVIGCKEKLLNKLQGDYAIGHNRYSTTGGNALRNIQPFFADTNAGGVGVAHNGNLTNSIYLRKKLKLTATNYELYFFINI